MDWFFGYRESLFDLNIKVEAGNQRGFSPINMEVEFAFESNRYLEYHTN